MNMNDEDTGRGPEGQEESPPLATWTVVSGDASFQTLWLELGPAALVVFPLSRVLLRVRRIMRSR